MLTPIELTIIVLLTLVACVVVLRDADGSEQ